MRPPLLRSSIGKELLPEVVIPTDALAVNAVTLGGSFRDSFFLFDVTGMEELGAGSGVALTMLVCSAACSCIPPSWKLAGSKMIESPRGRWNELSMADGTPVGSSKEVSNARHSNEYARVRCSCGTEYDIEVRFSSPSSSAHAATAQKILA